MLQHLVSIGEVLPEEEFYVEVISTGKWYSGTVLEAFIFCVNDVLHDVWENEKNARRVAEELIAQAFELSALMQLANTKANALIREKSELETAVEESGTLLGELEETILRSQTRRKELFDPYTGEAAEMSKKRNKSNDCSSSSMSDCDV